MYPTNYTTTSNSSSSSRFSSRCSKYITDIQYMPSPGYTRFMETHSQDLHLPHHSSNMDIHSSSSTWRIRAGMAVGIPTEGDKSR